MAAKRRKSTHPAYRQNPIKHYTPGAPYISAGGREYRIATEDHFFVIKPVHQGRMAKGISGKFMSWKAAEEALIRYLRDTDRNSYARYPGKESRYAPFNGE